MSDSQGFKRLIDILHFPSLYTPTEKGANFPAKLKSQRKCSSRNMVTFIYRYDDTWMGTHGLMKTNCHFDGRRHTGCLEQHRLAARNMFTLWEVMWCVSTSEHHINPNEINYIIVSETNLVNDGHSSGQMNSMQPFLFIFATLLKPKGILNETRGNVACHWPTGWTVATIYTGISLSLLITGNRKDENI